MNELKIFKKEGFGEVTGNQKRRVDMVGKMPPHIQIKNLIL